MKLWFNNQQHHPTRSQCQFIISVLFVGKFSLHSCYSLPTVADQDFRDEKLSTGYLYISTDYTHTQTHAHVTHMHAHTHTFTPYPRMHAPTRTRTHARMCTRTHTHTHTLIHTPTHRIFSVSSNSFHCVCIHNQHYKSVNPRKVQGRRQEFTGGVPVMRLACHKVAPPRIEQNFFGFHSALFSDFEKRYNKPILRGTLGARRGSLYPLAF